MKKSVGTLTALLLAGCMIGAGCQSFSDLVPEEFGAWENHYIYRGNVRSKTTGEDWEYLVTEVTEDGVSYDVQSCMDYAISGDEIYMCLNLASQGDSALLFTSAIVKYNVQTKTQETVSLDLTAMDGENVTWNYEPYNIEKVFEDKILLYGNRESITLGTEGTVEETSYSNLYYTVDHEGNLVDAEAFNYWGYTRESEDYWSKTVNEDSGLALYYITWGMEEPVLVCHLDSSGVYYTEKRFVEKNGVKGFLIKTYIRGNTVSEHRLAKLEFFNVENNQMSTLFEGNPRVMWVEIPEEEYFLAYDYGQITYTTKDGLFGKATEQTVNLSKSCVLYKIDYKTDSVTAQKVYTFDENGDYTFFKGVAGNKFYVRGLWYENARGCNGGGREMEYYELDLTKGKLNKISGDKFDESEEKCWGDYARQSGVACGDYFYYIQRETLSAYLGSNGTAYLLKRYQSGEEKMDVMQIWNSNTSQPEGAKYCFEMWKGNGGELDDFIVRNY